jgi:TonB family protein
VKWNAPLLSLDGRSWAFSFALHVLAFAILWGIGRPRFLDLTQVDWALLGAGASAQPVLDVELDEDDTWRRPDAGSRPRTAPRPKTAQAPSGPGGTGSGYRTVAQVSRLPQPLSTLEPAFPEAARRAGVEGTVILQVDIDEGGLVKQVAVVQALGYGCEEAAVEAVRQAKFRPAAAGDQLVPVRVRIPFRFQYQ